MIKDDGKALVVCNPIDAYYLMVNDEKIKRALVITEIVPVGELTVIPEDEFIKYLNEGLANED